MNKGFLIFFLILLIFISACTKQSPDNGKVVDRTLEDALDQAYEEELVVLQDIHEHNLVMYQFLNERGTYSISMYDRLDNQYSLNKGTNGSYSVSGVGEGELNHTSFVKLSRYHREKNGYFLFGHVNNEDAKSVVVKFRADDGEVVEQEVTIKNQSFFYYVKDKIPKEVIRVSIQ